MFLTLGFTLVLPVPVSPSRYILGAIYPRGSFTNASALTSHAPYSTNHVSAFESSQPSSSHDVCGIFSSLYLKSKYRIMSEKLVKDLSYEAHRRMDLLLLPPASGRDWKTLADKMGYSNEDIKYFECIKKDRGPVMELISDYESKEKPISDLISLLNEMERFDLIEDLQPFIEKTPFPWEREQKERREFEQRQTQVDRNKEIKTISERYDVFICYAGPDKPFADEILQNLEQQPYCMKVCIDYRDFLPGGDRLETAAKAIEERCSKVLLILSENFHRCEVADFQAKIALNLSPGARKMILIPILYKPCKIPSTLRFITYLDYTTEHSRKFFWSKLLASLGYKSRDSTCNGKT